MKKNLLFILLTVLFSLFVQAENYPYRSDVLWVTVPNHADWVYKTGEKATVEVQFYKYGIPQDGVTVNYELGDDMMPRFCCVEKRQGRHNYGDDETAWFPRLPYDGRCG